MANVLAYKKSASFFKCSKPLFEATCKSRLSSRSLSLKIKFSSYAL